MNKPISLVKKLQIIWGVLSAGLLFFMITTVFAHRNGFETINDPEFTYILQIIAIVFLIGGILTVFGYVKRKIRGLSGELNAKSEEYQRLVIISFAVLEGCGFMAVTGYLITADRNLLLLAVISFILLLLQSPSKARVERELGGKLPDKLEE